MTQLLFRLFRRPYFKTAANLKHNRILDASLHGCITDQFTCPDFRIGVSRMSHVGCEIAAVYNGLLLMGKRVGCGDTIAAFEENRWLMGAARAGTLGSDPFCIPLYLKENGVDTVKYGRFRDMEPELLSAGEGVYILSFWNRGAPFHGIHTVALRKEKMQLRVYNHMTDYAAAMSALTDERHFILGIKLL